MSSSHLLQGKIISLKKGTKLKVGEGVIKVDKCRALDIRFSEQESPALKASQEGDADLANRRGSRNPPVIGRPA